jgi:hypothetical protein
MIKKLLFLTFVCVCSTVYAATDYSILRTSNGTVVSTTNPLPVTFGTGDQTIDGALYVAKNVGIGTTAAWALLNVEGSVYMKGNVGIGTTAPAQKLDVEGSIYGRQAVNSSSGGLQIWNSAAAASVHLWVNAVNSIQLDAGATGGNILALNAGGNGNIGLGTSTPSAKVDVGGGTLNHMSATNGLLVKGSIETDASIYPDGAIYQQLPFDYFRSGPACYRINKITAAVETITCSTAPGL